MLGEARNAIQKNLQTEQAKQQTKANDTRVTDLLNGYKFLQGTLEQKPAINPRTIVIIAALGFLAALYFLVRKK